MEDTKYPTHEWIGAVIGTIVRANLDITAAHNRENLDDIIADLIALRDKLPNTHQYYLNGEL